MKEYFNQEFIYRKPTHLTESFKCINFALVTTIFFAVILVIDITVKTPKYCHIIAIIQHFLGLSAWFWLASIAKGIYDNSEKVSKSDNVFFTFS